MSGDKTQTLGVLVTTGGLFFPFNGAVTVLYPEKHQVCDIDIDGLIGSFIYRPILEVVFLLLLLLGAAVTLLLTAT